jgi:hypothetical protein
MDFENLALAWFFDCADRPKKMIPAMLNGHSAVPICAHNVTDPLSAYFKDRVLPSVYDGQAWEDLIRAARQELVLPAFGARIREVGIPQIPTDVADFLSAVGDLNAERNQVILSELSSVALLLNAAGIEPVLLKGAAYCVTGVYANPGSRYLWDVDLLVPESQMSTAVDVLKREGFDSDPNSRLGDYRHHHPPLQRRGSIAFELHHSLGMGICRSLLPATEVLEQSASLEFRGARIRVPSPEHMMTHLIMHSQIQHPYNERIWPSMRAMYDLVLLRRRFDNVTDWSAIQRRFRKAGRYGVLALHLRQVEEVLGAGPPFPHSLDRIHIPPLASPETFESAAASPIPRPNLHVFDRS